LHRSVESFVRKSFDLDELGLKDQVRTSGLGFAKNPKRPENEWSPEEKLIDSKMSLQFVSLGSNSIVSSITSNGKQADLYTGFRWAFL
jgi:hypothetical protein